MNTRIRGVCILAECDKPHYARGWCKPHWSRWHRYGDPLREPRVPALLDRLRANIEVGDCWTWTRSTDMGGYGQISVEGVQKKAHRAMWELLVGPIPEGLFLDHLCRNTRCINPDHLEPVTPGENTRRGIASIVTRRMNEARRPAHCPRGHEYTEENSYRSGTSRWCRTCKLERSRARYAERTAA